MKKILLFSSIAFIMTSGEVLANQKVDTIVVTANKKNENITQVNGSVQVKSGQQLEQSGVLQVQQLEKLFSGLQIRSRGNRTYSSFSLRGISSPDFYNPSILVYVDGVQQDPQFMTQELINIKQVELLRGPQSTLYGGNAQAGIINIITNSPKDIPPLHFSGDYSILKQGATLTTAHALVDDSLYASANFRYLYEPGKIDQVHGKSNFDDAETWSGNFQLKYMPEDLPLKADYKYSHENLRSHDEVYLTKQERNNKKYTGKIPILKRNVNSYSLKLDYDLEQTVISSISSYQDRHIYRNFIGGGQNEDRKSRSQEFRLNTQFSNGINTLVGTYWSNDKFIRKTGGYSPYYEGDKNEIDNNSLAVFGETVFPVLKQVDLTLGGRFSYDKAEIDYHGRRSGIPSMVIKPLEGNKSFRQFTPKISLGWQINPQHKVYSLVTQGYKPGGFNHAVSSDLAITPYNKETSTNYEIGLHSSFLEDRLTFNEAIYFIKAKDKQIYVGPMGRQQIQNFGKSESKGIELNIDYIPFSGLDLYAGLNIGKSIFSDSPKGSVSYQGKRIPYAPDISSNAGFNMLIDQNLVHGDLYLAGNMRYFSKSYFDESNQVKQSAYAIYDVSINLDVNNNLSIKLFGENLGNKRYQEYAYQNSNGTEYGIINKGRNIGLTLSYQL